MKVPTFISPFFSGPHSDTLMKRTLGISAALSVLVFLVACGSASDQRDAASATAADAQGTTSDAQSATSDTAFTSLFNGENLDGWHRHEDLPGDQVGGEWVVENGAIVGDQYPEGHGGFLVTDETYENYVLEMEANLDYPVDSGIFLRVGETGESHQVTLDYRPEGTVGAIYMAYLQGFVDTTNVKDQFREDGWNDLRARIEGHPPRIQFWLNGEKVTDFRHTEETVEGAPRTGMIGLQVHPGESYEAGNKVRFRNIRIRELP